MMRISEKVLDLANVNLLFVLSCLPFTIGIAKISLYQTYLPLSTSVEFRVIRSYAKPGQLKIGCNCSLELTLQHLSL